MVIELGDIASWPAGAVAHVDGCIECVDGAPDDAEETLRAMFAGHRIRAYHCTRLLDHEEAAIRTAGMRPLTKALLRERIMRAHEADAFTAAVRDQLLAIVEEPTQGREGISCYYLPLAYLSSSLGRKGLPYYLGKWGGERLSTARAEDEDMQSILETIGRPRIVVAAFDVSARRDEHRLLSLLRVCMEIRNGKRDVATEILASVTVIPEAIWRPGDPDYNALGDLPQR